MSRFLRTCERFARRVPRRGSDKSTSRLFRGALLRCLLRRTTPAWSIFLSALIFALVHPLASPTIGSVMAVPALLVLGLVSANAAVRTGNLSASILLHTGFNLLTAIVGIGLNVLLGLAGQVSFGHVGFYALGAYTVAILTVVAKWSFWAALRSEPNR